MVNTIHNDVTSQLEAIGLSQHEAALYVEILRNGEASVGIMLEHVKLHREQAYRALKHLEEEGFIRQYEKHKKAYFSVTDTDLLIEKVEVVAGIAKSLQKTLKNLHKRSPHIVRISEGDDAFESLYENVLNTIKKDGEYLILGGQGKVFESLKNIWPLHRKYSSIYAKKNIKLRMVAFEKQNFSRQLKVQPLLEIRQLPGQYFGPVATVIFANKVALEVMDPENVSIVTIENQKIAASYKEQFEALWSIAKPYQAAK